MNCIIIDDESTARVIIRQLCSSAPNLIILDEFPNALEAMKFLNQQTVDLIFLDIHMPDFTGFDFLDTLKLPPKIILTTSDKNFAIQAFEYNCIIDYLIKPITPERFLKAVRKAEKIDLYSQKVVSEDDKTSEVDNLYVNIDRRLIKIDIPSIYLVEAKGDYINIRTDTKNFTVHSSLLKIQEKLPDTKFLKVHRSYIINVEKIIDIEDNSVLINKDVIPVSRSHRAALMKRLNLL